MALTAPYNFDKPVRDADAPPYPSERFYDAKLWQFVRAKGAKGASIWNVTAERQETSQVSSRIDAEIALGTTRTGSKSVSELC